MEESLIAELVATFIFLLLFGGFFIWGLKTGQFRNVEDSKYHILDQGKKRKRGDKNDS